MTIETGNPDFQRLWALESKPRQKKLVLMCLLLPIGLWTEIVAWRGFIAGVGDGMFLLAAAAFVGICSAMSALHNTLYDIQARMVYMQAKDDGIFVGYTIVPHLKAQREAHSTTLPWSRVEAISIKTTGDELSTTYGIEIQHNVVFTGLIHPLPMEFHVGESKLETETKLQELREMRRQRIDRLTLESLKCSQVQIK